MRKVIYIDQQVLRFFRHDGPRCVEGDATKLRTYSQLTEEQLCGLYQNETGLPIEPHDYNTLLQVVRVLALRFLDQQPAR